jgi:hypothetical protein
MSQSILIHYSVSCLSQNFFTEYGFFWFLWTDFVPRGLACLTLIYLMFYKPIKLNVLFSRDKNAAGSESGAREESNTGVANTTARYRDDADMEEEEAYDTDNPMHPRVTSLNGRRGSLEMKHSSMRAPSLMTDFFRESEDFDLELEMAMESR